MSLKKQHRVKIGQKIKRQKARRKILKKGLDVNTYFQGRHYIRERKSASETS